MQTNVDKDEGGIFKARNNSNDNNAKTVPDSRDMYVDKPVDHRNARQVIDVIWFSSLLFAVEEALQIKAIIWYLL